MSPNQRGALGPIRAAHDSLAIPVSLTFDIGSDLVVTGKSAPVPSWATPGACWGNFGFGDTSPAVQVVDMGLDNSIKLVGTTLTGTPA